MMRLNLVLLLAVVLSSLYLVNLQYESRHLYSELDRAQAQAGRLASQSERLQVEKRAQATSARVESLAKAKLQMRAATPAITTYVANPQNGATSVSMAQSSHSTNAMPGHLP
ncbi:cell division protein FtsL [Rhodoferax lithotrophicus]|uniref:Cell division protein FtsL n=1 Tax=Rhodoferax lithotrophicus TaxID=2798804 RepID=A0ABM7MSU2_9BURK|nr:cell division protein FtsL [Rhodoferax sp. MIZ03]BCO29247.1 cell division protein FtsL [Rhodoferax sp. MIZ03]